MGNGLIEHVIRKQKGSTEKKGNQGKGKKAGGSTEGNKSEHSLMIYISLYHIYMKMP